MTEGMRVSLRTLSVLLPLLLGCPLAGVAAGAEEEEVPRRYLLWKVPGEDGQPASFLLAVLDLQDPGGRAGKTEWPLSYLLGQVGEVLLDPCLLPPPPRASPPEDSGDEVEEDQPSEDPLRLGPGEALSDSLPGATCTRLEVYLGDRVASRDELLDLLSLRPGALALRLLEVEARWTAGGLGELPPGEGAVLADDPLALGISGSALALDEPPPPWVELAVGLAPDDQAALLELVLASVEEAGDSGKPSTQALREAYWLADLDTMQDLGRDAPLVAALCALRGGAGHDALVEEVVRVLAQPLAAGADGEPVAGRLVVVDAWRMLDPDGLLKQLGDAGLELVRLDRDHTAFLGIFYTDADEGGVRVTDVIPDTAAAAVELQKGDVILRLDDWDMPNGRALVDTFALHAPGEQVELTIKREGEQLLVPVALGERPPPE
jgi:PDZ domain